MSEPQPPLYGRPFGDSDGNTTGPEVHGVFRGHGPGSRWGELAVAYLSPLQHGGPAAPVISLSTRNDREPHWTGCALDLDQARELYRLLGGTIARAEGEDQRGGPDTAVAALRGAEQLLAAAEDARLRGLLTLREAGMTWAQLGERLGISRHRARARYVPRLHELVEGGTFGLPRELVSDRAVLPPPTPPVIGRPAISDARAWCRWCGERLISDGEWHHTTGPDSTVRAYMPPDSEPHDPWPAEED